MAGKAVPIRRVPGSGPLHQAQSPGRRSPNLSNPDCCALSQGGILRFGRVQRQEDSDARAEKGGDRIRKLLHDSSHRKAGYAPPFNEPSRTTSRQKLTHVRLTALRSVKRDSQRRWTPPTPAGTTVLSSLRIEVERTTLSASSFPLVHRFSCETLLTVKFAQPLWENDAVSLGVLLIILAFVFATSASKIPFWRRFYRFVPSLLLCYFLPSLLTAFGIVDAEKSNLYFVASRYLLPTSLVLLTLSVDLPRIVRLGPKALIMFFTGTLGIFLGGPLALLVVSWIHPESVGGVGPEAVWRGLTTVAGSWIGGGANQTAMKEVFEVGDGLFSAMIAVDVLVANVWMAVLLVGASHTEAIDRRFRADTSAIDDLKDRIAAYQKEILRIPSTTDLMVVLAVGFGVTALAHFVADLLAPWIQTTAPELSRYSLTSHFFWLVVLATTAGVVLSFTRARQLEGAGASRLGTIFLYVLVATIGMKMDLTAVTRYPTLFAVGFIWIGIHGLLLVVVGYCIRAPMFFLAVGSQANVGGAASAPIVASAFHPALAPVGVLLAVLGYVLGTYAAWLCGLMLQAVASGSVP